MKLIHFSRGLNHVSIDVKTVTNNASIGTQPWIGNFDDSSFILGDHSTLNNDGKFTNDGLFNTTNLSGNIINRVKGTMVNNGLFNQGGLGVFSNQSSSTFTNSGRVNVFVSLLDNRGTIDNSGIIKIFHFGAYQNKGGVLDNKTAGNFTNAGSASNLENSTIKTSGAFINDRNLVNAGIISILCGGSITGPANGNQPSDACVPN